jgi:hypothetical protein
MGVVVEGEVVDEMDPQSRPQLGDRAHLLNSHPSNREITEG